MFAANAAKAGYNSLILLSGAPEGIRTPDPQIRSSIATSDGCKLARAEAAAEVGKLEPDLINPLAEERHGKADAVPGRDRLFLVA
jgi:hypothetical protein